MTSAATGVASSTMTSGAHGDRESIGSASGGESAGAVARGPGRPRTASGTASGEPPSRVAAAIVCDSSKFLARHARFGGEAQLVEKPLVGVERNPTERGVDALRSLGVHEPPRIDEVSQHERGDRWPRSLDVGELSV